MAKPGGVGIVGGVEVGLPILMTMGAFLTIALYNVIELTFLAFVIFKQRKKLYFWSFIIATWGIALHGLGYIFKFFQVITIDVLSSATVGVGWVGMVTGQSVVLYSRLHLVVWDKRRIRWVLYMIITNAIIIHCPMIAIALCTEATRSPRMISVFLIFDKVQIVVFFVQEVIISILYIYETVRLLGRGNEQNGAQLRKLLAHLILVNVVVLIFDITILAAQFGGFYQIQTTYKTAVYSIKLKIEFSILNRLVGMVKEEDILGNRQRSRTKSLSLGTWTSSKKTQPSTSTGSRSLFIKMNDLESNSRNDRQPTTGESNEDEITVLGKTPLDSKGSVERFASLEISEARI